MLWQCNKVANDLMNDLKNNIFIYKISCIFGTRYLVDFP